MGDGHISVRDVGWMSVVGPSQRKFVWFGFEVLLNVNGNGFAWGLCWLYVLIIRLSVDVLKN